VIIYRQLCYDVCPIQINEECQYRNYCSFNIKFKPPVFHCVTNNAHVSEAPAFKPS